MGSRANYFVMCPKAKARPLSDLLPALKMPKGCTAGFRDGDLIVEYVTKDWEEPIEIGVALLTETHVLVEAMEIVDAYGQDRPDKDVIATYDARYQLVTSLSLLEHTFEVMWILSSRLAETCDGVIFNTAAEEWVDPF